MCQNCVTRNIKVGKVRYSPYPLDAYSLVGDINIHTRITLKNKVMSRGIKMVE